MNFFCCYSTVFVQRLRQKPYFATQKSAAAWFFSFTEIHILIFCNSNFFSWYPWWPKYATLDYKGSKFLPADGSRGQKLGRGCMAICRPGPWVTCSTLVHLGARCPLGDRPHSMSALFKGGGGWHMLTSDDIRGVGVSRMMMSTFVFQK